MYIVSRYIDTRDRTGADSVTWTIESVRDAAATPADVFRLYADPATWSHWGHNATWARADGPLVEGGTVVVLAGYGKVYRCDVRRFVTGQVLAVDGGRSIHL